MTLDEWRRRLSAACVGERIAYHEGELAIDRALPLPESWAVEIVAYSAMAAQERGLVALTQTHAHRKGVTRYTATVVRKPTAADIAVVCSLPRPIAR